MSQNRRNTRFFWLMLIVLGVAIYVAVMFTTTFDSCGRGARVEKHWQVVPPRWVCGPG